MGALHTKMSGDSAAVLSSEDLESQVQSAFDEYDVNRDGVISFVEFMHMIAQPPWSSLLPSEVRGCIESLASREALVLDKANQAALNADKAEAHRNRPLRPSEAIKLASCP